MVAIAVGFHLFPFRTEKLSPLAPMVLRKRESRSPPFLQNPDSFQESGFFCLATFSTIKKLAASIGPPTHNQYGVWQQGHKVSRCLPQSSTRIGIEAVYLKLREVV